MSIAHSLYKEIYQKSSIIFKIIEKNSNFLLYKGKFKIKI